MLAWGELREKNMGCWIEKLILLFLHCLDFRLSPLEKFRFKFIDEHS